jgi:hypothetical protein
MAAILVLTGAPRVLWSAALPAEPNPSTLRSPLLSSHRALRDSLRRLSDRSAAWRNAVKELRTTGRQVLILTSDQVRMADFPGGRTRPFDEGVLAETQPLADAQQRVNVVVVVVNLALLERSHASPAPMFDFEADLDRILAHEVYGHAMPYLLAGTLAGRCADPELGQRAADSCAIHRENEVRLEAGLGLRMSAGLEGLALARNGRH